MKKRPAKGKIGGFTLIELLVVVLIIGILSAIALPEYTKAVEKSRAAEAQTLLRNLLTAEKAYKLANLGYTTDLTLLDLQMPNIGESSDTFSTKDWIVTMEMHPLYPTTFTAFAARAKDGAVFKSPQWGIFLSVASDGTETWKCQQSIGNGTVPDICKGVTGSADGVIK